MFFGIFKKKKEIEIDYSNKILFSMGYNDEEGTNSRLSIYYNTTFEYESSKSLSCLSDLEIKTSWLKDDDFDNFWRLPQYYKKMIGHIENYGINHFYVNIDAVVKIVKKQGNCFIVIKNFKYNSYEHLEIELTNDGFDKIIKKYPFIEVDVSKVLYDRMITNIELDIIKEKERHMENIKDLNNLLEILNQSKEENLEDKYLKEKLDGKNCSIIYE